MASSATPPRILQLGSTEVRIFESLDDLSEACAAFVAGVLSGLVEANGDASIALAGGSTPKPIYERLARAPLAETLNFDAISFYFGDERFVAPDHADSNARMVRDALKAAPRARIETMNVGLADPDAVARDYEARIPEQFDVVVLGAGEDGHTASLFPGSPALREKERRVVAVVGPKPPPQRMTLTAPVLTGAKLRIVAASGAGKAAAIARALADGGSIDDTPLRLARSGVWFVDRAAATKIA